MRNSSLSTVARVASQHRKLKQPRYRLESPSHFHHCVSRPICNTIRLLSTDSQRSASRNSDTSSATPAAKLNHNVTAEEKEDYDRRVAENKGRQIRTPWHREGSDQPPVSRQRSAGAMTKGKLLTTPSRMLKLILPLTTRDANEDRKDIEPLALLVHPQQPLSYLERLIQSELPILKNEEGKERVPNVYFRAEDSQQGDKVLRRPSDEADEDDVGEGAHDFEVEHSEVIDGKRHRTGKLNRKSPTEAAILRGGHGEGGVESYSGLGQDANPPSASPKSKSSPDADGNGDAQPKFVRWSSSTEIGDFIRDAARGREFAVEIEGAPTDIRVGVPSFQDRTYYLRMRLRKKSGEIAHMADVKKECDRLAHKGAQRIAIAGFGGLVGWWALVYKLTFGTDLGWDVMEPVTYLVGLSTLMGGYVWFLYHNREVSYRSAMNFTISRRQQKLYSQHNFDLRKWEDLIEEAQMLRREIKGVAQEYDVEWDELADEKDEKVMKALKKDREKKKGEGKGGDPASDAEPEVETSDAKRKHRHD